MYRKMYGINTGGMERSLVASAFDKSSFRAIEVTASGDSLPKSK